MEEAPQDQLKINPGVEDTSQPNDAPLPLKADTSAAAPPIVPIAPTPMQPAPAVLETPEAEGNLLQAPEGTSTIASLRTLRRGSTTSSNSDYFSADPARSSSSSLAAQGRSGGHDVDPTHRLTQDLKSNAHGSLAPAHSHDTLRREGSRRHVVSRPPQRSKTDQPRHPEYPEQSFAALQLQDRYYHSSAFDREYAGRSPSLWQSPPPDSPLLEPRKLTLNTQYSRTTSSTPAQTPGLFAAPSSSRPFGLDIPDEQFSMPSPYLHPVQAPPPRTTRSANRDVDYVSGRKLINGYEIIDELGRGVQGKVKLAKNQETGELVAIKIVQRYVRKARLGKPALQEDKLKKEIAILKKVRHPNVVRLIEVIDDPDIAKVYIVLEFCEQRELIWRTEGQPHIVLMEFSRQCHDYGSLPLDTSLANIDRVQRKVLKKRATQERNRKQARAVQRIDTSNLWSLEYAAASDEESGDEAPLTFSTQLSRYESRSAMALERIPEDNGTPKSEIGRDPFDVSDQENADEPSVPAVDQQLTPPAGSGSDDHTPHATDPHGRQERAELETSQHSDGFSFYSTEWYQDEGSTSTMAGIDEAIRRKRQASIATSSTSGLTETMENEVPEYYKFVPTMTIPECRSVFRDALVGISYLHYHGIIHRDIKPENLLRTHENRVKITDFGVSYSGKPVREPDDADDRSEAEPELLHWDTERSFAKTVGTPAFYAPELCDMDDVDDPKPIIKELVDVWALGITLFCLVFARVPFDAENEFVLMRRIHEEDIFIPRLRLKAVDPHASVKPPGQAPLFQKDKRNPQDFELESIDDELHDLMSRLYSRDPDRRISLAEIRHHPWVLRGIPDPSGWLDETDPARFGQGRTLEPSKEEVAEAVVPITLFNRLKSIGKRATSALGLGAVRKRGQSSATSSENGSATSIPEMAEWQGRKQSVQYNAHPAGPSARSQQREKELEHPLSRGDTASPELDQLSEKNIDPPSPTSSPIDLRAPYRSDPTSRPTLPDRHGSHMSTAGSIKTVRQADFEHDRGREESRRGRRGSSQSSPGPSDIPQNSQALQTPATISSMITGSARSIFRAAMRSRERFGSGSNSPRQRSGTHTPAESETPYGETMTAVNMTQASGQSTGHLDFPADLKEKLSAIKDPLSGSISARGGSSAPSPQSSTKSSAPVSRQLSMLFESRGLHSPHYAQPSSPSPRGSSRQRTTGTNTTATIPTHVTEFVPRSAENSDAEYQSSRDEPGRRRSSEVSQSRRQPVTVRGAGFTEPGACNLSSHDEFGPTTSNLQQGQTGFESPSISQGGPLHPLSLISSDETSSTTHSRSTSFPSVPSAVSADSSVFSETGHLPAQMAKEDSSSSSDTADMLTIHPQRRTSPYASTSSIAVSDPGYHGDGDGNGEGEDSYAVRSDSDEDSDDDNDSEDEYLTMGQSRASRSRDVSLDRPVRQNERRETTLFKRKESRSGSTNTMTKVRTRSAGHFDHEQQHDREVDLDDRPSTAAP